MNLPHGENHNVSSGKSLQLYAATQGLRKLFQMGSYISSNIPFQQQDTSILIRNVKQYYFHTYNIQINMKRFLIAMLVCFLAQLLLYGRNSKSDNRPQEKGLYKTDNFILTSKVMIF